MVRPDREKGGTLAHAGLRIPAYAAAVTLAATTAVLNGGAAGASPPVGSVTGNGGGYSWGANEWGQLGNGGGSRGVPGLAGLLTGNVRQFAAGTNFSVAVLTNGTVLTWGMNSSGTLGDGSTNPRSTPGVVAGLPPISQVSASPNTVLALGPGGTVWAWGDNSTQQIGDGTTGTHYTPFQVPGLANMVQVAAGNGFSLALRDDGKIFGWGANNLGQLGDGTNIQRASPTPIFGLVTVAQISAGNSHALGIRGDGTVWAWGSNGKGELGLGDTGTRFAPAQVPGLTNATSVSAGWRYSLVVADPGAAVWAFGWNSNAFGAGLGELGDGSTSDRHSPVRSGTLSGIVQVAAGNGGANSSAAVGSDGSLWTWGGNVSGQLGIGSEDSNRTSPTKVTGIQGVQQVAVGYSTDLAIGKPFTTVPKLVGESKFSVPGILFDAGLFDGNVTNKATANCSIINTVSGQGLPFGALVPQGTVVSYSVWVKAPKANCS